VLVDDTLKALAPELRRTGPQPCCSDSELITMILVGEACGWALETDMLSQWREHRDLFPNVPDQSRFNRRRRNLALTINTLRRVWLGRLDLADDRDCVIDSMPVPAVEFHLAPMASADWSAHGATFGYVAAKKQMIFGYRLHLLTTLNGLIIDFALAPANAKDLDVAESLLDNYRDLLVLGDKGYVSQPVAASLYETNGIRLCAMPRRNQHKQWPADFQRLVSHFRHIIETVNGQLVEQFSVQKHHAHGFWGLCARLYSKLAAHTLCFYLNRLLGSANCLQIKQLALN
jgi:hypothetical protein